ncbi:uncharacterized protein LAESUDRAFT_700378 [Laetiporus sulphureus 93-53]|uniref:Acyl-protein thioesterase 1 n=1 Tax=Laetiporus sulphureus 93-53 TaxID=1314785 RepID=A0A165E9C2_9APHY|nr:uncharacterized protein LAESUDRAFT_700378 [Laetiporus sulphureus 93-53]KZT06519.1 hypothetical protein LAESUDRAFT_700378 [Laetiporus sulphureus 93-53]
MFSGRVVLPLLLLAVLITVFLPFTRPNQKRTEPTAGSQLGVTGTSTSLWTPSSTDTSPANTSLSSLQMAGLQPLKLMSIAPRRKHTATVIMIHGVGESGASWKPNMERLAADSGLSHVKWVLPSAILTGSEAVDAPWPAWFDVFKYPEDEAGILAAAREINQLISAEVDAGIPSSRIVLGGFSQGGAMSITTGLTSERKLAGVFVLSGWLPLTNKFKMMASDHVKSIPIFWGHGKQDPVISYQFGLRSVDALQNRVGVPLASQDAPQKGGISFHAYDDLDHAASNKELRDLSDWLKIVLPAA